MHLDLFGKIGFGIVAMHCRHFTPLSLDFAYSKHVLENMCMAYDPALLKLNVRKNSIEEAASTSISEACPNLQVNCLYALEDGMHTAEALAVGRSAFSLQVTDRGADLNALFARVRKSCERLQRC